MSDGEDQYPKDAVLRMQTWLAKEKRDLEFFVIGFGEDCSFNTLSVICNAFKGQEYTGIKCEELANAYTMIVRQTTVVTQTLVSTSIRNTK